MESIVQHIVENLHIPSKELSVAVLSTLPIIELRGGIPIAILYFKLAPLKAYVCACIGNLIPVLPLVLFFGKIEAVLQKHQFSNRILAKYIASVKKRTKRIEHLEIWGLAFFVAIPLPITGAWTGSVAAFLLGIPWKKAFFSIASGVLIAGLIVTLVTLGGAKLYSFL